MLKRKYLLDRFQKHLELQYQDYCDQQGMRPSIAGLITYLIDLEMLSGSSINRFTLRKEFDLLYPDHDFHKTDTINTMATRFNLSERSIWDALRSDKKRS